MSPKADRRDAEECKAMEEKIARFICGNGRVRRSRKYFAYVRDNIGGFDADRLQVLRLKPSKIRR